MGTGSTAFGIDRGFITPFTQQQHEAFFIAKTVNCPWHDAASVPVACAPILRKVRPSCFVMSR